MPSTPSSIFSHMKTSPLYFLPHTSLDNSTRLMRGCTYWYNPHSRSSYSHGDRRGRGSMKARRLAGTSSTEWKWSVTSRTEVALRAGYDGERWRRRSGTDKGEGGAGECRFTCQNARHGCAAGGVQPGEGGHRPSLAFAGRNGCKDLLASSLGSSLAVSVWFKASEDAQRWPEHSGYVGGLSD